MAIVGSNEKPIMMRGKKRGKILGDTGSWYKSENKKKYEDNWDAIFNKPTTKTETKAQ
jgi:hypothetical protein|tara:strand:+ start:3995 stop:4168 length:174 start_codon:yes stop_codon:yes gene_type:complete